MELVVIIAACGVIAVWALSKTARAIRTLREQRRDSDGVGGRGRDYGAGQGIGGIDPGGSSHGSHGGDCGGHGGGDGGW
jgi:hypothetical protein